MPLVSIITASYNAVETISKCLESVRAQDYCDVEHLIIDGGSIDGTMGVVERFARPEMSCVSEPDNGIYDAWNKGIDLARGEWIGFLGADDLYLPGAISAYMRCASEDPEAEYLSGRVRWLGPNGKARIIGEPWRWPKFQRYMTVAHVGSLHRRSLFERYGRFDTSYRMVADYEMLLRPRRDLKTAYLSKITAEMRCGGATDSAESLDEAARAKVETGRRPRVLVELERLWARALFRRRRNLRD